MSSISFVSFEEIGYGSREDKENIISYLLNNENDDALSMTTIKEIKATPGPGISSSCLKRNAMVISMYYSDEMTMKEIGMVLSITESRVSQIHSQAVLRLRSKLRKDGFIED